MEAGWPLFRSDDPAFDLKLEQHKVDEGNYFRLFVWQNAGPINFAIYRIEFGRRHLKSGFRKSKPIFAFEARNAAKKWYKSKAN